MTPHSGPLKAQVAGRTDHLPISVEEGAYVVPADVVSGLGEGNTEAGYKVLGSMFPSKATTPSKKSVPIIAAGGEYVIHPAEIVAKFGNLESGHRTLDAFVIGSRHKLIKTLSKLPGPKKD